MNDTSQRFEYLLIEEIPIAEPCEATAAQAQPDTSQPSSPSPMLATFERLYESLDRRLCMFETAEGHLACVQAARLV